jgi:uncharacterized protein YdhG (YjbR/CyaY superfamily)
MPTETKRINVRKPNDRRSKASAKPEDAKPTTFAQYLARVSADKRSALESLRSTIRRLLPEAEEGFSYGLPAFRLRGRPLVAFGASEHHCALYPMSPAVIEAHLGALKSFDISKGTIRFQPDHPLPASLVQKLVKARLAESQADHATGGGK